MKCHVLAYNRRRNRLYHHTGDRMLNCRVLTAHSSLKYFRYAFFCCRWRSCWCWKAFHSEHVLWQPGVCLGQFCWHGSILEHLSAFWCFHYSGFYVFISLGCVKCRIILGVLKACMCSGWIAEITLNFISQKQFYMSWTEVQLFGIPYIELSFLFVNSIANLREFPAESKGFPHLESFSKASERWDPSAVRTFDHTNSHRPAWNTWKQQT